ncbi:DUF58 domain-containing protein [Kordiimonas marina]|uniref:DUF58 domain-containing protein n=1 Tax=Kordiimonas marina TaxID=2872312 RepID=UPI001FF3D79E|nr:DUF58 domain-containing protein [Kordiimonas marina]MCJ9427540.1 DUF58 domain-containing protein [Kordiimonas marina]
MRPTLRTFWLVLLAVPMALLLLALGGIGPGLVLYYLLLLGFLLLLDWMACPTASRLRFTIEEPPQIFIGDEAVLKVGVERLNGAPMTAVEVAVEVNDKLDQKAQEAITIAPGAESGTIDITPRSRGIARIPRVWFRWAGPLGLARRQFVSETDLKIPVLPNFQRAARSAQQLVGASADEFGPRPHPRQGDGSEFSSLREYVAGMDPRTVDWKRSARYRGLLAKEYEAERNHQIILAFDTGHLMAERLGGLTRLDHMINAGLVLAHAALKGGDKVGLFGFDSQVRSLVRPLGGMTSFTHLQHHMAALECSGDETNYTLAMTRLAGSLTRRTLVILFTDFADSITAELMRENLGVLAVQHLVVFVALKDPYLIEQAEKPLETVRNISEAATASELLKERRLLFSRLRRQGVLCLEPAHGHLVGEVFHQYRTIINQELI